MALVHALQCYWYIKNITAQIKQSIGSAFSPVGGAYLTVVLKRFRMSEAGGREMFNELRVSSQMLRLYFWESNTMWIVSVFPLHRFLPCFIIKSSGLKCNAENTLKNLSTWTRGRQNNRKTNICYLKCRWWATPLVFVIYYVVITTIMFSIIVL